MKRLAGYILALWHRITGKAERDRLAEHFAERENWD